MTILTIDTGFIFRETAEFREEVMRRYKLPLEVLKPSLSLEEIERYGEQMRTCTPELCCQSARSSHCRGPGRYDADDGHPRDQTPERGTRGRRVGGALRGGQDRPLAHWTEEQVWDYVKAHNVPVNPLLHQGWSMVRAQTRPCTLTRTEGRSLGRARQERVWAALGQRQARAHERERARARLESRVPELNVRHI